VLSCVLPAERAAAVTGDFLEDAGLRGQVWFWNSVVRTVTSRILNDFRGRPFAMMGIAVAGLLRNIAFAFPPFFALAVFTLFPGHHMGEGVMVNVARPGTPPYLEPMWQINWTLNILWAVWLFYSGRWAARRIPGMELASGVAIAMTGWAAIFAWAIYLHFFGSGAVAHPGVVAWHDLPLIAGTIVQRRRRVAYGS
jgi:hypothetical protein